MLLSLARKPGSASDSLVPHLLFSFLFLRLARASTRSAWLRAVRTQLAGPLSYLSAHNPSAWPEESALPFEKFTEISTHSNERRRGEKKPDPVRNRSGRTTPSRTLALPLPARVQRGRPVSAHPPPNPQGPPIMAVDQESFLHLSRPLAPTINLQSSIAPLSVNIQPQVIITMPDTPSCLAMPAGRHCPQGPRPYQAADLHVRQSRLLTASAPLA